MDDWTFKSYHLTLIIGSIFILILAMVGCEISESRRTYHKLIRHKGFDGKTISAEHEKIIFPVHYPKINDMKDE